MRRLRFLALTMATLAMAGGGGAQTVVAPVADASVVVAPAVEAVPVAPPAAVVAPVVIAPGQVVFYRKGSFIGAALGCTVHDGDAQIARLGSGKYWVASLTPGKHVFRVQSEVTDLLTLEIESGETYYVQCSIGMGIMAGRPNLSPSDKATYDLVAAKLKPWVPKPAKG